jgi:ParB family chromosome partitioning protein
MTTLVQISTAYGAQKDGGLVVPRNKYVEIHTEKPTNPKQRDWPEYKSCKFTTEAIVTEGSEKGELRRVCANPECPVHHARKQPTTVDAVIKAEQEKRRRDEAIAQTTGLRVLSAIVDAVPVRLMKRDLLFVVESGRNAGRAPPCHRSPSAWHWQSKGHCRRCTRQAAGRYHPQS